MSKDTSPPRLVVIDDDPDIGALVNAFASKAGFEVTATTEYGEFKDLLRDDTAVVVLDLMMPEVDGIEVIRYLSERNAKVGLILASGVEPGVLRTAHDLAVAQGLWVIGSLSKPFTAKELISLLRKTEPDAVEQRDAAHASVTVEELQKALQDDDLVVFYQPKVEVATRTLVAVEALVRWQHLRFGLIRPNVFMAMAEASALIDEFTECVMAKSFAQQAAWRKRGIRLKVAVNVSARSLTRLDLPERILELAASNEVEPGDIIIEVTESSLSQDQVTALDILTRLRMKGVDLSIDDFGTGYSSMDQLKRVPFSELKIDRSFVVSACHDAKAHAIVESSVNLGHRLRLRVVAEGVQSLEEWEMLKQLRCDQAQGYYISAPMRGSELLAWHQRWQADS